MRLYDYAGIVVQGCLLPQGLAFQLVHSNAEITRKLILQQQQTVYTRFEILHKCGMALDAGQHGFCPLKIPRLL